MEAPILFFEALFFFISGILMHPTQTNNDPISIVIERMVAAQETFDPIQYKAQMRFKYFDTDTFAVRRCTISYRSDANNRLYGYDWKHEETFAKGYTYTLMALPDGMYFIYKDDSTKYIRQRLLKNQIDLGAYHESMRYYFLLDQVIEPFFVPVEELTMRDSSHYYILSRNINELMTGSLIIDKETYLPVRTTTVDRDPDFGLTQILDVSFTYDFASPIQPDSIFSVDHYKSAGYEYKFIEDEPSATETLLTFSLEQEQMLLDYPFISESADTQYLRNAKAPYILLDFWFASCMPCLKAIPEVNALGLKYQDDGLQVIGINCFDKKSNTTLTSKLRDKGISIPLLYGERDLVNDLNMTSYPSYVIITPNRKIEYINGGIDEVKKSISGLFDK